MTNAPKDSGMQPAPADSSAPASSAPDAIGELLALLRTLINHMVAMRPVWEAIAAGLSRPKDLTPTDGGMLATPSRPQAPPPSVGPAFTARPAPRAPGVPAHVSAAMPPSRPAPPARAAPPRGALRKRGRNGADLTPAQQMGMIRDGLAQFPYLPEFNAFPFDTFNHVAGFTHHIKNEASPHRGKTWAQLVADVSGKALLWWRVRRQVKDELGGQELFPGSQAADGSYPALAWDQWKQKFADEAITALWALAHADDIAADGAGAFSSNSYGVDDEEPPE